MTSPGREEERCRMGMGEIDPEGNEFKCGLTRTAHVHADHPFLSARAEPAEGPNRNRNLSSGGSLTPSASNARAEPTFVYSTDPKAKVLIQGDHDCSKDAEIAALRSELASVTRSLTEWQHKPEALQLAANENAQLRKERDALCAVVEDAVATMECLTGRYGSSGHYFRHKHAWFVKHLEQARRALQSAEGRGGRA